MIQAIVTDVDGVIVGSQHGHNFPLPNPMILSSLEKLNLRGLPIILCTAKYSHAVKDIIVKAKLQNPHITDGGALIINPIDGDVIKQHTIPKKVVADIIAPLLQQHFYTELYETDRYFLQKDHVTNFTEKRIAVLQQPHHEVDSLQGLSHAEVIKILSFVHTPQEKLLMEKILAPFADRIHVIWSSHPTTKPAENVIITASGVSKREATLEVLEYLSIAPENTLGVGDTIGDWRFMQELGYAACTGEDKALQEKVLSKGKEHSFLAASADKDGFLDILEHFCR